MDETQTKPEAEEKTEEPNQEAEKKTGEEKPAFVVDAEKAAVEMKKQVEAMKVENDRRDEMRAREALGGTAEAGQHAEAKEETPKEYSDRIMNNEVK